MIHVPDMIGVRADRGLACCLAPDHHDLPCPTCRGESVYRQVGRMSAPEVVECPQCENIGTVIACRHCEYEQHITDDERRG